MIIKLRKIFWATTIFLKVFIFWPLKYLAISFLTNSENKKSKLVKTNSLKLGFLIVSNKISKKINPEINITKGKKLISKECFLGIKKKTTMVKVTKIQKEEIQKTAIWLSLKTPKRE